MQWALLVVMVCGLVLAAIPVFSRIVQFADEVEFRYLVQAFAGSAQNVHLRAALKNENKQNDIVIINHVGFRLSPTNNKHNGFPFALENGAETLADMHAKDCGELLEHFTGQSYWLDNRLPAAAEPDPQSRIRAIVVRDKGIKAQPYCRFERPVRTGFGNNGTPDSARHVFAYYPASGRVEVLRETGVVE